MPSSKNLDNDTNSTKKNNDPNNIKSSRFTDKALALRQNLRKRKHQQRSRNTNNDTQLIIK